MGDMIKRIELVNFMSHEHTVIEPAPGLTVLIGPNNCGKSAVVAALQMLCTNDRGSAYVVRHDEKHCSVKVETSDGHTIEWRRKKSPSYVIDGKLYDRIEPEFLEELHKTLKLPSVVTKRDVIDVHFGAQKSPIFLLDSTAGLKAEFFAASSDAVKLIAMQQRHKDQLAERKRLKGALENESKQINQELALLEPAVTIDERLDAAEKLYGEVERETQEIAERQRIGAQLTEERTTLERWQTTAKTLARLSEPPRLAPEPPLAQAILQLQTAEDLNAQLHAGNQVLQRLAEPPRLLPEAALQGLLNQLQAAERHHDLSRQSAAALHPLSSPPVLARDQPLAVLLDDLRGRKAAFDRATAIHDVVQRLPPACCPAPVEPLVDLLAQLTAVVEVAERWEEESGALRRLTTPPAIPSPTELEAFLCGFEGKLAEVAKGEQELAQAAEDLRAVTLAIRESAAEAQCPTCGAPLDADRVLARTAAGMGVHGHE